MSAFKHTTDTYTHPQRTPISKVWCHHLSWCDWEKQILNFEIKWLQWKEQTYFPTEPEVLAETHSTSKDLYTELDHQSHSEGIPHETKIHYWAKVLFPMPSTSGYTHLQLELELPESFAWTLKKREEHKVILIELPWILISNLRSN